MNKKSAILAYFLALALVFTFSMVVFSSNPSSCSGNGCYNRAWNLCQSDCAKIGKMCATPWWISGYCLGMWTNVCISHWGYYCEDGTNMTSIQCEAYDPRCYQNGFF